MKSKLNMSRKNNKETREGVKNRMIMAAKWFFHQAFQPFPAHHSQRVSADQWKVNIKCGITGNRHGLDYGVAAMTDESVGQRIEF